MARGRGRELHRTSDEQQIGATPAVAPAGAGNVHEHVLGLQRDYGNQAVTTVVQRREHAASTDAPGHKAAPPKKQEKQEDYAPTAPNPKFNGWTDAELTGHATDYEKGDTKNGLAYAIECLEEYWFRHRDQSRAIAMNIWRDYKKLGDAKREAYWLGVMQGTIKPGHQSSEDMSDKGF